MPARSLSFAVVALLTAACRPALESKGEGDAPEPAIAASRSEAPAASTAGARAGPTSFEGREIAPTMGVLGARWLTRPERDAEENTTLLHEQLGLAPGQVACDVGAGNGYHTLRMAEAVGASGEVIASDLQPEMLALLRARAEAAQLSNIRDVEASPGDPALPAGSCDLILLVDVYHEFAAPERALASLRGALAEGGRVALVEYREEDPEVPIKARHKMSKAQILREYLPRGFELASEFDGLPWQHLMFFTSTKP